ncbi:MAG: AAA family ATPase [Chloroflexi bacterium]|nr:AAA family ATPase [Chloroflexota bacterium]
MIHLRTLSLNSAVVPAHYPFSVPAVRALQTLEFGAPVTFFVGENGSGKSTLLEALAVAAGSVVAGSAESEHDSTLSAARELGRALRLVWNKKTRRGFFLRAEDFFGYVKQQAQMRAALQADLAAVDEDYQGRSEMARALAKSPYQRELHALQRYGRDLNDYSHGESFFAFFKARFVPGGLYLLDEPEAPLSPLRQLAFLSLLKEALTLDAQFIIATHSPLLMAFPGAAIYDFDQQPPRTVAYDALEHVRLTRDFLANPALFLKDL